MDVTNNDTGEIEIRHGRFQDTPLWFPAEGTILAGTLLARPSELPVVDPAVTVVAGGGNNGDGTVTAIVVSPDAVVGEYTLECTAEEGHGGTFSLTDPHSVVVSDSLVMDAGDGDATVFTVGGLQITVTDGDNDFDIGDTWALTVALEGTGNEDGLAMAPFDPDGSDGFELVKAVLPYDVTSVVEKSVAVAADNGNTGDGTVAVTIVDESEVLLGPYVLACTAEVEHGGVFSLTDPEGTEVSDSVTMTPDDGGETVVVVGGLRLVITDGDEDFNTAEFFTITITEGLAVRSARVLVEGEINRDRLLIHADGDGDNIDAAVRDELRSYGIVAKPVHQLAQLDNQ